MHFCRTSSNRDRRMRKHRTSLNGDRRMRNPPHVCTSVRSLQPMYVHPSLQHMCVHRFASRIHLRNHVTQVWLAGNECEHLSRNSTCILSQHIACASVCSLQPTLPVYRCGTSARPSLRCADALASTGFGFRACAETTRTGLKITGQNETRENAGKNSPGTE